MAQDNTKAAIASMALYITYDGILDNISQSQVMPYLKKLSSKNITFTILSFEKKDNLKREREIEEINEEFARFNIYWKKLKYHKKPAAFSTFFDIISGTWVALKIIRNSNVKIIHARSYVAASIAVIIKKICKTKFIFDIRGFWVDERVEANIWKRDSLLFKFARYIEKILYANSDQIVSLTVRSKLEIESWAYFKNRNPRITVIPTCVDLDKFKLSGKKNNMHGADSIDKKNILIYSGSLSTWYLPFEMLKFFKISEKNIPGLLFLLLTGEKEYFAEFIKNNNLQNDAISTLNVNYKFVPDYLAIAMAGLAFYKPGYSRIACCPTKVGEYLACGLPVIINKGIGDMDEIIRGERVGIILDNFLEPEYERVSQQLKNLLLEKDNLSMRCRAVAEKYFSLEIGAQKYLELYRRLLKA